MDFKVVACVLPPMLKDWDGRTFNEPEADTYRIKLQIRLFIELRPWPNYLILLKNRVVSLLVRLNPDTLPLSSFINSTEPLNPFT